MNLAEVIYMLKHSVKLRHYLLCGCVAACHGMACVLYGVQNATESGGDKKKTIVLIFTNK